VIRRARADDAERLTILARSSKATWGYDAEFMALVAPLLDFSRVDIGTATIFVLEDACRILGFYRLNVIDGKPFCHRPRVATAAL